MRRHQQGDDRSPHGLLDTVLGFLTDLVKERPQLFKFAFSQWPSVSPMGKVLQLLTKDWLCVF